MMHVLRIMLSVLTVAASPALGMQNNPNQATSSVEAPSTRLEVREGIVGKVTDEMGRPLDNAFVEVTPQSSEAGPVPDIAVLTDVHGRYEWQLRPGRYVIAISRQGFKQVWRTVDISPGRTANVEFIMPRGGN
jgi:hypothetical protein